MKSIAYFFLITLILLSNGSQSVNCSQLNITSTLNIDFCEEFIKMYRENQSKEMAISILDEVSSRKRVVSYTQLLCVMEFLLTEYIVGNNDALIQYQILKKNKWSEECFVMFRKAHDKVKDSYLYDAHQSESAMLKKKKLIDLLKG